MIQAVLKDVESNINVADGGQNEVWHLTRACSGLVIVARAQQVQIDTLRLEHQAEINSLKNQVARLQEAVPLGAQPAEKACPPRLDRLKIETDPATPHGLGELLRGE